MIKPELSNVGKELRKVFKVAEFNSTLTDLGLNPTEATDLDIKVECLVGTATKLVTPLLALKATTYSELLDLKTPWGVVGDATQNGWDGPDMPFFKSKTGNAISTTELVAYVNLKKGEIKFRKDNKWDENLGGAAGVLKANGDNIKVDSGSYKITINPSALTFKIEAFSWGIVGDATAGGWGDKPDQAMRYDPTVDLWRAEVSLKKGEWKFRQNNKWDVNYGLDAGDKIKVNGGNFKVEPGIYLITADFNANTFSITPTKFVGIVGDATPTGWGGPDMKFSQNLITKKWELFGIKLTAGQIKFRENDDWGVNYGSVNDKEPDPLLTGGGLKNNGKNFGVTAGTWDFELDLTIPDAPKYKATKK
ncbi:MAG: SusF/SusE family outer membrane protein [Saprospiraceae bacterium]|nr:SusF/SusE family outer membrane protein [Saprospiraceae bacterium]